MNLDEIEKKCFILALFIRDDKQRFLLGSGAYEFKEKQLHFAANVMSNDVVEVQGNDGYMLAGQVRRPTTQVFDGYIGDATVNKQDIEGYRRDFFGFFQKNHFYTVVYVFPDGSAIQRRRGFIVDAAEVKELWQLFPEYHIGMNFEDINYYKYSEDEDGEETYGSSAEIALSTEISGGLIWEDKGQIQVNQEGTELEFTGTINNRAVDYIDLYGNSEQKTMTGKNLLPLTMTSQTVNDVVFTVNADGSIKASGTASARTEPRLYQSGTGVPALVLKSGITYHNSMNVVMYFYSTTYRTIGPNSNYTPSADETVQYVYIRVENGDSIDTTLYPQLEKGSQGSAYEQYCGGTPSPNPDYPQEIKTVAGEQTITVSDGGGQSQDYVINLGKNLFDKNNANSDNLFVVGETMKLARNTNVTSIWIRCTGGETYTIQKLNNGTNQRFRVWTTANSPSGDVDVLSVNATDGTYDNDASYTVTVPKNARYLGVLFAVSGTTPSVSDIEASIQIEKGSTATTYAPYITPIELCKMGNYQDYIYSTGGDYFLHKELGKHTVVSNEPSMAWDNTRRRLTFQPTGWDIIPTTSSDDVIKAISDMFIAGSTTYVATNLNDGMCLSTGGYISLRYGAWTSQSEALAQAVGAEIYYALQTETDTQITDAGLIAQLEALNSATCYGGITWIKSEATEHNLPATMMAYITVNAGGGIEWDANGAVWEAGGGGNTTIMINSIENVYPVWTVVGPATNPVLTNLTTGTSISYSGSVSSSQKLVIDMLNQTAKLNGTSVIGNAAGEWLEFIPGNNTVSYSADNADAPNSTIEWQEVVG